MNDQKKIETLFDALTTAIEMIEGLIGNDESETLDWLRETRDQMEEEMN